MKQLIVFGICLILGSTAALATDNAGYVTDIMKITMRTGQGLDYKILDWVKSGEEVEILQQGDQWTMVRRADGKEGWVGRQGTKSLVAIHGPQQRFSLLSVSGVPLGD